MNRVLAACLWALGTGLALNSVLGPLALEVIRYPFSDSLLYQGIGLDFVSLVVVVPLAVVAGLFTLRGRTSGPAMALGIGAYAAYMAIQYVVGPEYLELTGNSERFFLLHLGLLVLGLVTAAVAWSVADVGGLPPASERGRALWGALMLTAGALLLVRYAPAIGELTAGEPALPAFRENPTSFLLIATLDLGVFLPAAAASGLGLRRGHGWARKGLHLVLGWLALVGLAVGAMSVTMWSRGDPAASGVQATVFVAVGVALALLHLRLEWPLLRGTATVDSGGDPGEASDARPKP